MTATDTRPVLQIDIVSDVVCPWCIVGFLQLDQALAQTGALVKLRWHPFELNPQMGPEGQNLREHIMEKYGSTPAQSAEARARLTEIGADLGFAFNFTDDSSIVNTFAAHQLLDWAEGQGRQHPLKLALFAAYFTHGRDVSDPAVLLDVVATAELDRAAAEAALASGAYQAAVREKQKFWTQHGISGVPSMVFGGKYLLTGAQGADTYAQVIQRCLAEAA
ncbi:DsbA family oxidoreductase [Ruegeria sp. PrR005]|uniref:DsbA family oxidoreductase n=1 Tax=Ruegeria sp. PrR005 TaxID=2706882 RepID=A0A6B2NNK2_9RHOB|nr:DsbA family oxidoreductase [Ruegeria sp. PrR005]NDW45696.1 DsbA family oxidoreductase [Ruegeria sp. PrR005]